MTTAIHHASCCTSRVCLCVCLGVLVCTTHFHNCICCGKRSTYSHFRLWFINPSDSSQCTHSFISAVTFFPSKRTAAIFMFFLKTAFVEASAPCQGSSDGSTHAFDIDGSLFKNNYFSNKMRLQFNVWFVRLLLWTKSIMDAERKTHNRDLVPFQFLKLNYVKCCQVR